MFEAQRNQETSEATNFLYARIQELETALTRQSMLLEQSKQREATLHRTIEGFTSLVQAKQSQVKQLEDRVALLEQSHAASLKKSSTLTDELEALRMRHHASLLQPTGAAGSSGGHPSALLPAPQLNVAGTPLIANSSGSFASSTAVSNESLFREASQLRRLLECKTHEADVAMLALSTLLRLQEAHGGRRFDGGASSSAAIDEVVDLVLQALDARRQSDLERHSGQLYVVPAFATSSPSGHDPRGGHHGSQYRNHGGDGAWTSHNGSATQQLLARENLELQERLLALTAAAVGQSSSTEYSTS